MAIPIYCPRCGATMERRFAEGRDREVCAACGFVFYRNPVPAVGVVVALDGRVVMIQRRLEPRAGCWALPAGYMELGESAEEAAIRECHEETGLVVQIEHLLGVYSFGEGEHSGLVIIYAATAVGGELHASDDALAVGAFALDALPSPPAFRTHLQAIDRWRREGRLASAKLNLLVHHDQFVCVRHASFADAPDVLGLLLDAPYEGTEQQIVIEALVHDRLHDPDRPLLVAEFSGKIVGVAVLSFHQTLRGWYATLDDIVVAVARRREGIGGALIRAAAQVAHGRGCTALHAPTAFADHAARALLAATGFTTGDMHTLMI